MRRLHGRLYMTSTRLRLGSHSVMPYLGELVRCPSRGRG
jgi:hypothetical protein